MKSNNKIGTFLIILSLISLSFSITIILYSMSLYILILSCSFFITFFISGFLTMIVSRYRSDSGYQQPIIQKRTKLGSGDEIPSKEVFEDKRVEDIRNDILETIKKLKEIDLED